MAKRRSKAQIQADKIIKANLLIFGDKVAKEARKRTRVRTGRLKKSINFKTLKDTVLMFTQMYYGSEVHPTKQYDKGEPDALLIVIKEMLPTGIEVIKKELTESILYPFRGGKKK